MACDALVFSVEVKLERIEAALVSCIGVEERSLDFTVSILTADYEQILQSRELSVLLQRKK